jgi:hypothetical protein
MNDDNLQWMAAALTTIVIVLFVLIVIAQLVHGLNLG